MLNLKKFNYFWQILTELELNNTVARLAKKNLTTLINSNEINNIFKEKLIIQLKHLSHPNILPQHRLEYGFETLIQDINNAAYQLRSLINKFPPPARKNFLLHLTNLPPLLDKIKFSPPNMKTGLYDSLLEPVKNPSPSLKTSPLAITFFYPKRNSAKNKLLIIEDLIAKDKLLNYYECLKNSIELQIFKFQIQMGINLIMINHPFIIKMLELHSNLTLLFKHSIFSTKSIANFSNVVSKQLNELLEFSLTKERQAFSSQLKEGLDLGKIWQQGTNIYQLKL